MTNDLGPPSRPERLLKLSGDCSASHKTFAEFEQEFLCFFSGQCSGVDVSDFFDNSLIDEIEQRGLCGCLPATSATSCLVQCRICLRKCSFVHMRSNRTVS